MNLVYYSISGNVEYVKIIELSISSLLNNKYCDDILIICDENIKNELQLKYPDISYMIVDLVDSNLSSGNKLRIYEYEKINIYENILYLDCDILISNDINELFEECLKNKDKFIVSSENSDFRDKIVDDFWAGCLLNSNEKELYKDIPSINAGCFLFNNNESNLNLLKNTYNMYTNGLKFTCYEQPYLNYNLLMTNKFINSIQKYITHKSISYYDTSKIINHFCGEPGNFFLKLRMMKMQM